MSDIKIDINTMDLEIENNDLVIIDEIEAIGQDIATYMRTIKGEWFRDTLIGVDYYGKIFIKNIPISIIDAEIRNAILSRPGVISIENMEISIDKTTRNLTIIVEKIKCKYGVFPFSENIGV